MIPVTVRLANSNIDVHITQRLSGLSWRSVAPGGYASATFSLQQPIDISDPMVAPFTRAYVYDGRNGDVLWEGRLQMSGRSAGDQGQVWALTAIGPSAHTLDQTAPLIYVDRQLDGWEKSAYESGLMSHMATGGAGTNPQVNQADVVLCTFPAGIPVDDNSRAAAVYQGFVGSGMELGAMGFDWDGPVLAGTWVAEAVVGTSPGGLSGQIAFTASMTLTGGSFFGTVVTGWAPGRDLVGVRIRRASGGPLTTSGDALWVAFDQMRVLGRRMDKAGNLTSASEMASSIVRSSWVVADLLGRMLPQYDGANAVITGDTVDIDQLAYHDPVNPSQVLDDLMKLEPACYWAAWESNAAGQYRFEWSNWPTSPRYEASVEDGFDSPQPAFEVYNKVTVRYKDPRGRTRTLVRTQAVEMLDNAGITRAWFEDLSDEAGSASNAFAFAVNFLAEHASPSSGGTLTIARPILDLEAARGVAPWQIKPGELIRVRGIEASQEITGAATRDGVTVFRIVSVEVNSEGQATLELDMFTQTESRALAEVAKRRNRKR